MRKPGVDCYVARMQSQWDGAGFGKLLSRILDEKQLSQRALAALGPIDPSLLSRWLSGATQPSFANLQTFIAGLRQQYPEMGEMVPDLISAAGYGSLADGADERPAIVRDNWSNQAVRDLWALKNIPPASRAGLVRTYLAQRAEGVG